ncbi:MAG TPA: hypothetical protein VII79_04150 [Candidatus Dormibacteraeota bacterium]
MTLNVEVAAPRRDAAMTRFTVRVDGMSFDVGVSDSDADQLAPGVEPKELVRESFRFLLEREPPESILSRFDLTVIERYFPNYRGEIARRLKR